MINSVSKYYQNYSKGTNVGNTGELKQTKTREKDKKKSLHNN